MNLAQDIVPSVSPRRRVEDDLADTVREAVRYLAFRTGPLGLAATFAPGRAKVAEAVARAARAAVAAHLDLIAAPSSPARDAAMGARRDLADQLAELRAGSVRQPGTARRALYLEALADFMIEAVRRDGPDRLRAWAARAG